MPRCNGTNGFSFPKDPILRRKWVLAVNKKTRDGRCWEPAIHSCVCRRHFRPEDLKEKNAAGFESRKPRLKYGIVPTIFDPPDFEKSVPKRRKKLGTNLSGQCASCYAKRDSKPLPYDCKANPINLTVVNVFIRKLLCFKRINKLRSLLFGI